MKIFIRLLAFVCGICPLCILKRRYPSSGYSRFMGKIEKFCPFCLSYNKLKSEK